MVHISCFMQEITDQSYFTENELDKSKYQTEIENIKQKLPGITPFFLKGKIKRGKIKIVKDYDFITLYHVSGSVNPNIREYTKELFKNLIENEYLKNPVFESSKKLKLS